MKKVFSTIALTIGVIGCLGLTPNDVVVKEKNAIQAASNWLSLVDKGRYEQSWNQAANSFKGAVSQQQWQQAMQSVRKPLGKKLSRKIKSQQYATSLPGVPDGEYVVIEFNTSFANKKSAIETVTPMLDKDGKWRVSGYYIK